MECSTCIHKECCVAMQEFPPSDKPCSNFHPADCPGPGLRALPPGTEVPIGFYLLETKESTFIAITVIEVNGEKTMIDAYTEEKLFKVYDFSTTLFKFYPITFAEADHA